MHEPLDRESETPINEFGHPVDTEKALEDLHNRIDAENESVRANIYEPAADDIQEHHIRRFKRIGRSMAKLLEEIRQYCPDANMYLEDSGNWVLLTGDSHEPGGRMRQDRTAAHERVPHSGGGAW